MLSDVLYRLRALFQRDSMEAQLDEELRAHLEQQAEKYVKSGMPREEAVRRARLELGGVDQGREEPVSAGDFSDWQEQNQTLQGLAAYKQWEFHTLTGAGEPDEVWASPVSANLFHLLGVNAIVGRTFTPNESQVVVLSHEYWRSHFASDPRIIGKV